MKIEGGDGTFSALPLSPVCSKLKLYRDVMNVISVDRFLCKVRLKDSRDKIFTFDASGKSFLDGERVDTLMSGEWVWS